jgi:histidine ammonia-lyase
MKTINIDLQPISLLDIRTFLKEDVTITISEECIRKIQEGRDFLDKKMQNESEVIYGINTGFGALYNTRIEKNDLQQLQVNLIRSHACGLGKKVPREIVRLMMFLKIKALCYGKSGVQVNTVLRLKDMLNTGITPIVYEQGSLGASGDLAPLAHLCLPLIGEGEIEFNGKELPGSEIKKIMGWEPIELQSKEGLALLNGTQFMSAYASYLTIQSENLWNWSILISAMSLEAFDGRKEPFHHSLHHIRPHTGQIKAAAMMRNLLNGSEIIEQHKVHVQDPYSFRCIPQVLGATYDTIEFVKKTVETEINSVTDNPTIFPEEEMIISGGNFHGQPLALAMDFLSIAMHEIGSIAERRIYQLINGHRGLPAFLTPKSGLNSGFMIVQYAAASVVSQNKTLCMPSSVDTIDSSKGQEDHVSMGANAATKTYRIIKNIEQLLGLELLTGAQAIEFRRPLKSSPSIEKLYQDVRKSTHMITDDVFMKPCMDAAIYFIQAHSFESYISNEK